MSLERNLLLSPKPKADSATLAPFLGEEISFSTYVKRRSYAPRRAAKVRERRLLVHAVSGEILRRQWVFRECSTDLLCIQTLTLRHRLASMDLRVVRDPPTSSRFRYSFYISSLPSINVISSPTVCHRAVL
jgi:hypothetical protein